MRWTLARLRCAASVCVAATVTACGGGGSADLVIPDPPPTVESVAVSPPSFTVETHRTQAMTARAFSRAGVEIFGRSTLWQSSNPSVAAVDGAGVVTGVTAGNAVVSADIDGRVRSAAVTVVDPVGRLEPNVASVTLDAKTSRSVLVTVYSRAGAVIPNQTLSLVWTSQNPSIATVGGTGQIAGVSAGTTSVTAAIGAVSVTIAVIVTDPITSLRIEPAGTISLEHGQSAQLSLTAVHASGRTASVAAPVWQSSLARVATVSASGLVTAVRGSGFGSGSIGVVATHEGFSASKSVHVYGWSYSTSFNAVTLDSTIILTRGFDVGNMSLYVRCRLKAKEFDLYVSTGNEITADGLVTYRLARSAPVGASWYESDSFTALFYPGSVLQTKSFAATVASSDTLFFQYRAYQGGTRSGHLLTKDMLYYVSEMNGTCLW